MVAPLARARGLSDLASPPRSLLASGWFPFISDFYWRAVAGAQGFSGLRVTSWFRTPEKNRIEGGGVESQHLFALAWDLVVPINALDHLAQHMRAQGLVAIREGLHVHVQAFPAGALARAGVAFPS